LRQRLTNATTLQTMTQHLLRASKFGAVDPVTGNLPCLTVVAWQRILAQAKGCGVHFVEIDHIKALLRDADGWINKCQVALGGGDGGTSKNHELTI